MRLSLESKIDRVVTEVRIVETVVVRDRIITLTHHAIHHAVLKDMLTKKVAICNEENAIVRA